VFILLQIFRINRHTCWHIQIILRQQVHQIAHKRCAQLEIIVQNALVQSNGRLAIVHPHIMGQNRIVQCLFVDIAQAATTLGQPQHGLNFSHLTQMFTLLPKGLERYPHCRVNQQFAQLISSADFSKCDHQMYVGVFGSMDR